MPEVLRLYGFSFFFYSNEHEPIHIHVTGKGGTAKFVFDEETERFLLYEKYRITGTDLRKIKDVIDNNTDIFIQTWKLYFYDDSDY